MLFLLAISYIVSDLFMNNKLWAIRENNRLTRVHKVLPFRVFDIFPHDLWNVSAREMEHQKY